MLLFLMIIPLGTHIELNQQTLKSIEPIRAVARILKGWGQLGKLWTFQLTERSEGTCVALARQPIGRGPGPALGPWKL